MKCPYLEGNGNGIQNKQMRDHLENMERDECIQDECEDFESCWVRGKNHDNVIEEVFNNGNANTN